MQLSELIEEWARPAMVFFKRVMEEEKGFIPIILLFADGGVSSYPWPTESQTAKDICAMLLRAKAKALSAWAMLLITDVWYWGLKPGEERSDDNRKEALHLWLESHWGDWEARLPYTRRADGGIAEWLPETVGLADPSENRRGRLINVIPAPSAAAEGN